MTSPISNSNSGSHPHRSRMARIAHDREARERLMQWKRLLYDVAVTRQLAPDQVADFARWAVNRLLDAYLEERMNKRIVIENKVRSLGLHLPNATVNKPYEATITLPPDLAREVADVTLECDPSFDLTLEQLGLTFCQTGPGEYCLKGRPLQAVPNELPLVLEYVTEGWHQGDQRSVLTLRMAVNPDPRTLWKNIPTPEEVQYYKPDTEAQFLPGAPLPDGGRGKDMLAASQRGRSHAQEGKPRDDHFRLSQDPESGWYVLAVADGAGSARFSREGSRIACDTVVDFCNNYIKEHPELEQLIADYADRLAAVPAAETPEAQLRQQRQAQKELFPTVYHMLVNAAFTAHRKINATADANPDFKAKDFATTLLLAVAKKFPFGWFVADFWVGDGAVCLYDAKTGTARLLGTPDEGEFSGQTRFLTMGSVFASADVISPRVRLGLYPDFTALMLMTDGVSDPMFETESNLANPARWRDFYALLQDGFPDDQIPGVELADRSERLAGQLADWLNFWSPGNHDDRTIALLY